MHRWCGHPIRVHNEGAAFAVGGWRGKTETWSLNGRGPETHHQAETRHQAETHHLPETRAVSQSSAGQRMQGAPKRGRSVKPLRAH